MDGWSQFFRHAFDPLLRWVCLDVPVRARLVMTSTKQVVIEAGAFVPNAYVVIFEVAIRHEDVSCSI
jgi:hypothetical protein